MRVLPCARRDPVHRLAFSADGRFLAANQGTMYHRGIEVFDLAEADAPTKVLDVQAAEPFFKFLADRSTLVVSDGSLVLFDLTLPSAPYRVVGGAVYPTTAFDISPDGALLVSARADLGGSGFQAWHMDPDGAITQKWRKGYDNHPSGDTTVFVSADAFIAAQRKFNIKRRDYDWHLVVLDAAKGKKRHALTHDPTIEVLQISKQPGTDGVVVRCKSGLIQFQSTIEPADPVHRCHGQNYTSVAHHPSGRHLAASSDDGTVSLLDADSLAVTKTFAWNVGPLHSVTFSADGTLAAAGSADGRVVVWDAEP